MNSRITAGIVIILIGVGFLIDEMIGVSFGYILRNWWPLIFVIIGLQHLNRSKSIWSPLIFIFVGIYLLLTNLDIIPGNFWSNILPLLLILIGVGFLTSQKRKKNEHGVNTEDSRESMITSIFSGNHTIIDSKDFKQTDILCIFGGVELDFRNAEIHEEAFVEINCIFGGVEIKVPDDWEIRFSGTPILGGFEDKTYRKTNSDLIKPVLNIYYTVIFGGINIKN